MAQEFDPILERRHHFVGCSLIKIAADALAQPQIVILTAQNLYHRFYIRKSLREYDNFSIAMACFLLGSKIENHQQILREVILQFFKTYLTLKCLRIFEMDLGSDLYALWKQELIALECEVLKELGFACYEDLDHPHFYVTELWTKVSNHCGWDSLIIPTAPQYILNLLNDVMYFDFIVQFDNVYIVAAVILLMMDHFQAENIQSVSEIMCSTYSLNNQELRQLKKEILHAMAQVPFLSDENTSQSKLVVDKDSKMLMWLEPVAEVPFLQLTEEQSRK